MGKHPDLGKLNNLFAQGTDFQLTDKLYEEQTGAVLPAGKSYLKKNSALAHKASEYGYEIVDIRDEPTIVRTVYFKKK